MGRKPILPQGANAFTAGAHLRQLRIEQHISLKEMAERLAYSKGYLSAIENGKERLNHDLLRKYEGALGLEEEVLSKLLQVQRASSFAGAITYLVKNAPLWISALLSLPGQQEDHLASHQQLMSEKELLHHLEFALRNAAEQGLLIFQTFEQHVQYSTFLALLAESTPLSEELRCEAIRQFLLAEQPNLDILNDICNRLLAIGVLSQVPVDEDMKPCLHSFFRIFSAQLSIDPFFRPYLGKSLHIRDSVVAHRSLVDILRALRAYDDLPHGYTPNHFERDLGKYTTYIEKTLHNLKLLGVVPKDRNTTDPELDATFVPLRISLEDESSEETWEGSLIELLENHPCIVLLGGPGSGKSTSARHLAWSHAAANLPTFSAPLSLLSGKPMPLRIELRRYSEERRRTPTYTLLSYATEVLLKREGVEINCHMFETLLERGAMLLIFDGLDEAATLNERRQLVQEIENFVLSYPGNRVLITSRPVGYDLAPCSELHFARARVQTFNDEQIQQFLLNWYHHVLKLLSLSEDDQRELEDLSDTLKTNLRLHKLAENPLLLTVITALHRYERLPDKRIRVYDRCAELLLDTWARLRGTDIRWRDMKMSKDDQYACVAYLGFVLHDRAQQTYKPGKGEKEKKADQEEGDNDVPQAFLLEIIEDFLRSRKVSTDSNEQQSDARRFCDLMLEEAGLIVERGIGSDGKPLYGFIHRTFQEYFAAYWIFDQFQEKVSLSEIEDFLQKHLHDPHWHEVILLLLGKLNTRPVTAVLQSILQEKIKSRRSSHNNILQQALFFVGSCLVEEIVVQQELAQQVISRLVDLTIHSPFTTQRIEAIEQLDSLVGTRQYGDLASIGLRELAQRLQELDTNIAVRVALALCTDDIVQRECPEVAHLLEDIAQRPDLIDAIPHQRGRATEDANQQRKGHRLVRLLVWLINCSQLPPDRMFEIAQRLYESSFAASTEKRNAFQLLIELAQRSDIPPRQAMQALLALYQKNVTEAEVRQQVFQLLINLARHPDLQIQEVITGVETLYYYPVENPAAKQQSLRVLETLAQRPDFQIENLINCAMRLYRRSRLHPDSSANSFFQELERLHHLELPVEEAMQRIRTLYLNEDMSLANNFLKSYTQRADIPLEKADQVAQNYYQSHCRDRDEKEQAAILLVFYALHPDAAPRLALQTFQTLWYDYAYSINVGSLLTLLLLQLTQRPDVSVEHASQIAQIISESKPKQLLPRKYLREIQHVATIQWLMRYAVCTDLSAEQAIQVALALLRLGRDKQARDSAWLLLLHVAQDQMLPSEQRLQAIAGLLQFINTRTWSEAAQIIRIVPALQGRHDARALLDRHWSKFIIREAMVDDIPALVELVQQEFLPPRVRNQIYGVLQSLIPRFHESDHTQIVQQEGIWNGRQRE